MFFILKKNNKNNLTFFMFLNDTSLSQAYFIYSLSILNERVRLFLLLLITLLFTIYQYIFFKK